MPRDGATLFDDFDPPPRLGAKQKQESANRAELARVLDEFNRKYAVVNENGKAVIYERARDPILKREVIIRIQFEDLKKLYMNQKILIPRGKDKTVMEPVAEVWLEHPDCRTYLDGVVFDPTGKAPRTCWNLWNGFAVEPQSGNWSKLKNHVGNVICAGNEDYFRYVIKWAARMLQYPDQQGEVALVFRGLKGAGKGIFLSALTLVWRAHGIHIGDAKPSSATSMRTCGIASACSPTRLSSLAIGSTKAS